PTIVSLSIIFVMRLSYPFVAEKLSLPASNIICPATTCTASHSVTRISQGSLMFWPPEAWKGLIIVSVHANNLRLIPGMHGRSECMDEPDGLSLPLHLARSPKHEE